MATVPTKFDHKLKVKGQWRKLLGMRVKVKGQWRPVVNGWSKVNGQWRPWVHTAGGGGQPPVHPPTVVHIATARASITGVTARWSIPGGRHVVSQRISWSTGLHSNPSRHSKSVSSGSRSTTLSPGAGAWGATVRYRYT